MDIEKWVKVCNALRNRAMKIEDYRNRYLLANFTGTAQQKDIEKRTPLLQDFFRIKVNVKGFSEKEEERRGVPEADFSENGQVYDALGKEFDMPYWAFHSLPNKKHLQDYNNIFIWQLKACNLKCPWCYVDDINKNGKEGNNARFFSMEEIIDVFEDERGKQELNMIRPSGGEPTLAIEQWQECLFELDERDLENDVYVQGDTNLTTGHFIEHLEETEQIGKRVLEKVGEYDNFGLLCSFKGTDVESFLEATGMPKSYAFLEEERWYTFSKLLNAKIDAYPFIYDPNPDTLESFMKTGARNYGDGFYLKTWLINLKLYGPEKERLEKIGVSSEEYQKQLGENFSRSEEIMQNLIWEKFKLNYKAIPRAGIKLKVQD